MNHTYRLVWNEAAQRYVPAAESARSRGKSGGCKALSRLRTIVLAAAVGGAYAGNTFAAPTGGTVVVGQGAISQTLPVAAQPGGGQVTSGNGGITQSGNSTVINQQSQNLAIDWRSFSIGANESVRFNQPNSSAIALNRVVGQDPSEIQGVLSANGQVFILNPNGVLFGKGAEVNVSALLASTLNLSDADFQAGRYQLAAGSSPGAVVNQGNLTAAAGGYLALVGPSVSNNGSMKVMIGTVLLAAGNKVNLQLNNGSLLSYSIDQGAVNALAQNSQLIQADGGRVFLSAKGADAVSKAVVNNTGIIEARTVANHDGVIRLLGDSTVGQVNVGGTLDASAPHGGDGGAIETSAAQVKVADDARVTTAATTGKTGTWLVDPTDFTIASSGGDISGATLDSELATTSVTLVSTSGKASGSGDIFVNDAVSWSANNTLTLTAARNIQVSNTITATGNTAGLTLNYGSGDNYYVNAGGKVTLSGTNPSLSIGGQAYTVIHSLGVQNDTTSTTLQGINNNLSGHYALGSDIDASATSGWTANQGLVGLMPLGNTTTAFTGQFAGLGHVISNLTVNYKNNSDIGLFGVTGTAAVIRDVGLSGGAVVGTDYVGPLVGFNQGTVLDSYASATGNDQHYLGGLVGENSGTITGSYATGALTSLNKITGGLVGINNSGGVITSSYATGTVTGVNKMLGGLVGQNLGTVTNSYATGSVGGGSQQMGGLVGDNSGSISNSYSTGTVTTSATTSTVGGLLGQNETGGTVTNSFWDKTTSGWTTSAGGTGMTTAQMQTQANFTSATTANGSVNPAWDFSSVWQMYSGSTDPLLKGFLKPITITANNASATYTSATWNGSDTYTCSIGSCSGLSGTITFGGTAAGAINVGNYSIVPGGLYSSSQQGYAITFAPGQLTITPANLTITGITAANKVYDSTVAAALSGTATVTPLGSDTVTLSGTGIGAFASKNVGTGKAVTVSGYTITGAAASNYTLVEPVGLTANITAASLVISGLTANNKVYNTTLADTLSGTATVTALGSDSVSLGGTGTAVFATKNVGTGRAVTVSGYTLSGADASNYTLVEPTGLTANITPASLVISGLTANNKVYTATLADTLSGTATVTALGSDSVALGGTGTAVFASKNVGTGRAVTVSGYTLSGADASNYTLVEPTGLTANITPASLIISGLAANNKVYDATLADTLSGTATVTALGSDSVSLGGTGTAVFASKNVGTGRAVTVSGYTLSGADASNYTLLEPTGLTANITPASLTVSGLTASNKVYDATLADTLSGTATVTALGSDSVSLGGTATAVFATKNVGTGRPVTVSGYTLSGADASNYTLVEPTGLTANITPASLAITGLAANNKVYNATLTDTLSGTATVTALGSDSVSLGGTGTAVFATKNVGTGRAVTVSGYTLSGADASNYTLVEPTGLTANITPASLAITGLTANSKVYDATLADTLSGTATVSALGSDSVALGGTGTAVFGTKNVGTGRAVTVSGYSLSGADASNYTLIQPTGLTANITSASLTVSGLTANNKVYDATLADTLSGTAAVTALGSDSVSLGGTGTAVFATKNVGTGRAVTVSGYTLSGADASNYTLLEPTGLTANITPASLAITGLAANNKIYDATTGATLSGTATIGALGSDSVNLGGTAAAVFATKNVGTGRAVTVSGYTLSGADASNYTLLEPTGLTANITPASLAVSGLTANNKIYDATTGATLSGAATIGALGSDSVTLGGSATAVFASKNVGTGRAITVSGYTLSGADASNYTLLEPTGLTANITPASLTVSGLSANNKVYDATLADTLSGTATFSALGSDSVSLGGTASAVFGSKNVGTGKAVTVSGYTLSGADASNYTLIQPTGLTANITLASLAISGLTANNKVYNATVTDTLSGTATVSALGSDSVSLVGTATAVFASKNVGTGKAVTVSGYTLSGADASNYTLIEPTGLTANVTSASLAISGLTANNKVYDATTGATLSGTATFSALGSDVVSLGGAGGAVFASKNVGTGKAVTVSGYTLSGADAGNYTLLAPTGLTANITAASLAISGLTANNKVYDATTGATLSGTATFSALGSDVVSLGGTGSAVFASKNVGTGKVVTVSGYTLSGADAGNYTLSEPTGLTANITAASLAISGLSANNKVYDATTGATLSGTATVSALGSDVVSLGGTASAVFASKNAATGKAVTVGGYTLSGADASNYTLIEPTGLTANITSASLAISGLTANNKVYDATTGATLSGTATFSALGSDVVSLGGTATAVFASKNVGTGKAVTVSGYTLSGADASNYTLLAPTGLTANITSASLAISGLTANNKVYDATTGATLSGTATFSALGSDTVSLGGTGSAVFASKNVGTGNAVTVSGYTLSGADAGNYTLIEPTGLTANITPANLAISGLIANNKVYDATASATVTGTAGVLPLGTDSLSLSGTGGAFFSDKNVGAGKAVTLSGYSLSGADAGNYVLVQPAGLTANISPASLLVSGVTASNKVYDATAAATLNGSASITPFSADNVVLSGTGNGAFSDKNAGANKTVTVRGYALTGADAGNYTLVGPTGLTANITPASLAITGVVANNKVYDTTLTAALSGTATVAALGSDNVVLSGSGSGSFVDKNVGSNKAVAVGGYSLSGGDAGNYTMLEPTGLTANITPASLVLGGISANNRVYDTTVATTLSGTATVNPLGNDVVSVVGTGTGLFSSKNVGTGKAVTVSGYTLSGADASNYTLIEPTGLSANISAANLLVSGVTASNKVYDTQVSDTLSGTASVTALGSDSVSLSGTGSGVFASKNVGTGKAVTVTGFTLSGADAGNYTLFEPTGLTANITPASLAITGLAANNKVYDGTVTATLSGTATVAALVSDSVVLNGSGSGVFADKNVGNNKSVTVGGYSLSGADAANYTLIGPAGLTANITPASLLISGVAANNKVYDTTVTATLSGTAMVTPLGNDNITLSGTGSAAFANKNVGIDKAVTVGGYTLSGADASNYTLIEPTGLSANISAANLLVSSVTASNKVYDTKVSDTLSGTASVTALGSDSVSLSGTGSGVFASKNAGTGKAVTVTGFTLSGTDAGNYNLVEPTGLTANITPASLAITGLAASNKVYDGTVTATLSGTATVAALVSDSVVLNGSGSGVFADKKVGNSKSVAVGGYSLGGADAANYTLIEPAGLTANITPASLLISGVAANNKVYDTTVTATLSGTAIVTPFGNDGVAVSGTGVGVFSDKNAGLDKTVSVSGYTLSGVDAGNYTLVEPTGLTANISPANLTVTGVAAASKVYNGTVAATLSGTAFVNPLGNDIAILTGSGIGTFADKNVGTSKTVNMSGYALSGADAANYTLVEPTNMTANITARPLTISATGINKVYDGSTNAAVTLADNRVAGDALATGYGSAAFADANVGTGKAVSVSGISLSGADAGNYTFNTSAATTANITAASLTIAANAATKAFDGLAYSGGNGVTFTGFVAGQTPSVLGGTLTYGGSAQGAINVGNYAIVPGGLTSSNYIITFVNGTLTITPAALAAAIRATSALYDATSTQLQ